MIRSEGRSIPKIYVYGDEISAIRTKPGEVFFLVQLLDQPIGIGWDPVPFNRWLTPSPPSL